MSCDKCGGVGQVWENDILVQCSECVESPNPDTPKQMKFHVAHMNAAQAYAQLSHCTRQKVGALLVSPENRPLLSGYNGVSAGTVDNCCEDQIECPDCINGYIQDSNYMNPPVKCNTCNGTGIKLVTKTETHHAERNLLGYSNRYGIPTNGCSIYVTLAPCIECAKQMEVAGIKAVYYLDSYRIMDGVFYLESRGITVQQIQKS